MKQLKEQNAPYIRAYVGFVVAATGIYAASESGLTFQALLNGNVSITDPGELSGFGLASIVYLLIARLLPTSIKECLVFWRWKERLPGYRAFTDVAPRDARISLDALRNKYGDFPTRGNDQNALWYRIYKTHESAPGVEDAHKHYLLYRDLNAVNLLLAAIFVPLCVAFGVLTLQSGLIAFGLLVAISFFFSLNARASGMRLVQNALAEESAKCS
jgi:hypothetical protein